MDLLTVVTHELGHVLGRDDLAHHDESVMDDRLAPGQRYLRVGHDAGARRHVIDALANGGAFPLLSATESPADETECRPSRDIGTTEPRSRRQAPAEPTSDERTAAEPPADAPAVVESSPTEPAAVEPAATEPPPPSPESTEPSDRTDPESTEPDRSTEPESATESGRDRSGIDRAERHRSRPIRNRPSRSSAIPPIRNRPSRSSPIPPTPARPSPRSPPLSSRPRPWCPSRRRGRSRSSWEARARSPSAMTAPSRSAT